MLLMFIKVNCYPTTSSSSSSSSSHEEMSTSESSDESQEQQHHHRRKNSYKTRVKHSLLQSSSKKQQIEDDEDLSDADLSNYNEIIDQLCAGDDNDDDYDDDNDDDEELNLATSLKNLNSNGAQNDHRSNLSESVGDLLANFSMNSKDFEMYRSLQAINNNNMVADENDIDEENMFAENDVENSLQKKSSNIDYRKRN
jgi:hypothetical protein